MKVPADIYEDSLSNKRLWLNRLFCIALILFCSIQYYNDPEFFTFLVFDPTMILLLMCIVSPFAEIVFFKNRKKRKDTFLNGETLMAKVIDIGSNRGPLGLKEKLAFTIRIEGDDKDLVVPVSTKVANDYTAGDDVKVKRLDDLVLVLSRESSKQLAASS